MAPFFYLSIRIVDKDIDLALVFLYRFGYFCQHYEFDNP